jgi:tRNA1Val (adenine37-N6)-methyltransferase
VTNPPYFTDSLKNPDPGKAAARHNFLLGNDDLLKGVRRLLSEDGKFQIILPYAEGYILVAEAQVYDLYCYNILKIKPLPTSEVKRLILSFSRYRQKTKESFLTIEHGARHEFTDDYISLTKDFYINF